MQFTNGANVATIEGIILYLLSKIFSAPII